MLDIKRIENILGEDAPKIIYYEETDSTNLRAKIYAEENSLEREPVVFIADAQSAGRGRLGRKFCSMAGAGLYITFLLFTDRSLPNLNTEDITRITPYLAVKLCEAIEERSSARPTVKWVNDLYLDGKKLAGILVEGVADEKGKIDRFICGLGTNVYKTPLPDEIKTIATSIEEVTGERASREEIAASLIRNVLLDLDEITSKTMFNEYKKRLTTVGKSVSVIKPTGSYDATVKALNPDYSLTLTLPDGREEILFTGEVSVKTKI